MNMRLGQILILIVIGSIMTPLAQAQRSIPTAIEKYANPQDNDRDNSYPYAVDDDDDDDDEVSDNDDALSSAPSV